MESLVQRSGTANSFPTIQRPWRVNVAGGTTRAERLIRLVNTTIALLGLVLLFPVLLLIAFLVWLDSPGPVLYTQVRVGLDRRLPTDAAQNHRRERNNGGCLFTIYKFRTMRGGAGEKGAGWGQKRDPPGTPVGRRLPQDRP